MTLGYKKMLQKISRALYWACKPGIYLLLHRSKRSRVVLRYHDEVLLIRSNFSEGKWGLPGGGIKQDETPEQSAAREVFEEVGVHINPRRLEYISTKRSGFGRWQWPYTTLIFFEYRLARKPKNLTLQKFEVSEAQWLSPAERSTHPIAPTLMDML